MLTVTALMPSPPAGPPAPAGTLEVRLFDEANAPLQSVAKLSLIAADGTTPTATESVKSGLATFKSLPPTLYRVALGGVGTIVAADATDESEFTRIFGGKIDDADMGKAVEHRVYFVVDKPGPAGEGREGEEGKAEIDQPNAELDAKGTLENPVKLEDPSELMALKAFCDARLSHLNPYYLVDKNVTKLVAIVGRASRSASDDYNLHLGYRRANAVATWFRKHYVHDPPELDLKVIVRSMGEKGANQDAEDPKDRHVDVHIIPFDADKSAEFSIKVFLRDFGSKPDAKGQWRKTEAGTLIITSDAVALFAVGRIKSTVEKDGVLAAKDLGQEIFMHRERELASAARYSTMALNLIIKLLEGNRHKLYALSFVDDSLEKAKANWDAAIEFLREARKVRLSTFFGPNA